MNENNWRYHIKSASTIHSTAAEIRRVTFFPFVSGLVMHLQIAFMKLSTLLAGLVTIKKDGDKR